jgi:hypothetical protein
MRDGVLSEMSIGFDAVRWEMRADAGAPTDPSRQVRHLLEVRLWEVSLVTWAADPQALVSGVHARRRPVAARLAALEAAATAVLRRSVDRRLADLEFDALRVLGGLR